MEDTLIKQVEEIVKKLQETPLEETASNYQNFLMKINACGTEVGAVPTSEKSDNKEKDWKPGYFSGKDTAEATNPITKDTNQELNTQLFE